jgi:hypothetical protein
MGMDDEQLAEIALLNGLDLEDRVDRGDWLKVIGE